MILGLVSSNTEPRLILFLASAMPTPCGRCKHLGSECKVDLRSGRCCECIRCGRKCDLSITYEEWLRLKNKKADLKKYLEDKEAARIAAMARKIQLRKRLAISTGKEAKSAEQELACITENEDKEHISVEAHTFLPPSLSASKDGLQMSPQHWALTERLPGHFWGSPGPQTLADDGTIFGDFDSA